jgi:hypothetical protein
MTRNAATYVELRKEAARQFAARDYREAQIALNVATQFYRDLGPAERRQSRESTKRPTVIVTLLVEVESRQALADIMHAGAEHSGHTYRVVLFNEKLPYRRLPYTVDDYRNAPSDIGPLAAEWKDKPHRLVYDLCREVERLTAPAKKKPRTAKKPRRSV